MLLPLTIKKMHAQVCAGVQPVLEGQEPIQSRCATVPFTKLGEKEILERLLFVAQEEKARSSAPLDTLALGFHHSLPIVPVAEWVLFNVLYLDCAPPSCTLPGPGSHKVNTIAWCDGFIQWLPRPAPEALPGGQHMTRWRTCKRAWKPSSSRRMGTCGGGSTTCRRRTTGSAWLMPTQCSRSVPCTAISYTGPSCAGA